MSLRKPLLLVALLALLMTMVTACAVGTPQSQTDASADTAAADDATGGGELVIGIRNVDYDTFDPNVSAFTQAAYVFRNIFDRLIYLDGDANYVSGLATSWEPSEDITWWTLTLRDDVTFHDGTAFNAEAVKFNFDRMVDPATGSKNAGPLLGPYNRTEVVDDFTVTVYFDEPYALFPFALASPFMGMVSPTAVDEYGDAFNEHLIGSGPFKFVSEIPGTEVVLERNPDYNWGPAIFHEGPAHLDRVVFGVVHFRRTIRFTFLQREKMFIFSNLSHAQAENDLI
ncbi:hypothetical protein KFU94_40950 [Chloroflexi bacterium TSY]|nr:hypothetical protein [Chloroflexi bacterium TSY]